MRIVLILAAAGLCLGADNTLTPDEKKAGFRLLFDGHSMNGWRDPASETPPGESWTIEDGCFKTLPKPRITEDLITRESFGDFEVKFDWRISPRGNTGVKYRIQRTIFLDNSLVDRTAGGFEAALEREVVSPRSFRDKMAPGTRAQEYTVSYEFQLIDDAAYPDLNKRDRLHSTGALYSMVPPSATAARPAGEWNHSRLLMKGTHVEHWINGIKVLDTSVNSEEARAGIARRWEKAPTIRQMLLNAKPSGPLSLQHHGAAVWFKNLKVRPL